MAMRSTMVSLLLNILCFNAVVRLIIISRHCEALHLPAHLIQGLLQARLQVFCWCLHHTSSKPTVSQCLSTYSRSSLRSLARDHLISISLSNRFAIVGPFSWMRMSQPLRVGLCYLGLLTRSSFLV